MRCCREKNSEVFAPMRESIGMVAIISSGAIDRKIVFRVGRCRHLTPRETIAPHSKRSPVDEPLDRAPRSFAWKDARAKKQWLSRLWKRRFVSGHAFKSGHKRVKENWALQVAEDSCFVSGHDFSRAVNG